mmetsp:Transcript_12941/g.24032  ORF Transcript_12941/g.24032 Transcript_12941/m.24032 type:complete len:265 (+) Transcript_12941:502-1296(+)|eukprot:CAMPEP_0204903856 /NCGR_PEP_ID=MMETSP1397-20131031/4508_1 /ASSEMBLY_ACC=CAM_ASM_000891 /TAXON_ID=49980 /ORGANISM="Climacostomum Climacostomum virens, Strain Stock W-24" /LENGTH=264 /DNA_ID=CAMNT_0052072561 /DNA_START=491 /DNA_END=1285 /DNA_ORIENTATION=+
MGKVASKLCKSCFPVDDSPYSGMQLATYAAKGTYEPITVPSSLDLDSSGELFLSNPYEEKAREITQKFLNSSLKPNFEGYQKLLDRSGIKVHGKVIEGGFSMITEYKVPYDTTTYFTFITDLEKRKKWDDTLADIKEVAETGEATRINYMIVKGFMTFSSRDLVLLNTQGNVGDALYEVSTSVDYDAFPLDGNHVRAILFLGGHLATPIDRDAEGNLSRIFELSEINLGGSISSSMCMKMAANAVPKYVKTLLSALGKDAEVKN